MLTFIRIIPINPSAWSFSAKLDAIAQYIERNINAESDCKRKIGRSEIGGSVVNQLFKLHIIYTTRLSFSAKLVAIAQYIERNINAESDCKHKIGRCEIGGSVLNQLFKTT